MNFRQLFSVSLVTLFFSTSEAALNSQMIVYKRFTLEGKDLTATFPVGQFRAELQLGANWPASLYRSTRQNRYCGVLREKRQWQYFAVHEKLSYLARTKKRDPLQRPRT